MKVLHFNQFGTHAGGVEAYIAEVSYALATAGHSAQLISFAPERPSDLMPGTVSVTSVDIAETFAEIERVIASYRPDVAYVHAVYDPRIVHYISGRLPAIAFVHGPYLICPGNALFLRRSAKACGRTAGPGCLVSAQIERCCFGRNPFRHAQRLRQVRALLKATSRMDVLVGSSFMQSRLIANGLQSKRLGTLAPLLFSEASSEFIPPSDPHTILFAGRLTREKGLRNLIQALASVRSNWRLIVAGDGPDRVACEQLAEKLGAARRVEFTGWVTPKTMKTLYKRCAFVTVPSLWPEPYGRVGPEAFLYGRPVVAYAVGGILDWLEDGETGYLATPGDIASLRAAIMRLMENPDEREYMGKTAQERAELQWNTETQVQRLIASFQTAIAGFGDRAP